MDGSELDRQITIQTRREKLDDGGFGQDVGDWHDLASVWASKQDVGGRETFGASQRFAATDTKWTIRWLIGVDAKCRILHEGTVYDIQNVAEIGRREGMVILSIARGEADAPPLTE